VARSPGHSHAVVLDGVAGAGSGLDRASNRWVGLAILIKMQIEHSLICPTYFGPTVALLFLLWLMVLFLDRLAPHSAGGS
jgi:hypothetical protein